MSSRTTQPELITDPEPGTNSFDVTFRIQAKHAELWAAAKRLGSVRALSEKISVSHGTLAKWIAMTEAPKFEGNKNARIYWTGERRFALEKALFDLTGKTLEELWPNAVFSRQFLDIKKEIEVTEEVDIRCIALRTEETLRLSNVDDETDRMEMSEKLQNAMRFLTPRSREIISKRYGIDAEPKTYKQIGKELNMTGARVRNIEARALRAIEKVILRQQSDAIRKQRELRSRDNGDAD